MPRARLMLAVAPLLVQRPILAREALRVWKSLVPLKWWRRAPFLPVPDRDWIAFRMETAFGGDAATPDAHALGDVLSWSAAFKRLVRERQRAAASS